MKSSGQRFPCCKWLAALLHLLKEHENKATRPRAHERKHHRHSAFLEFP